jgi:hypothetical protein
MGIRFLLKEIGFEGLQLEAHDKKELIRILSDYPDATVVLDYTNFDFHNVEDLLVVGAHFNKINWILFSDELSLPFLKRIVLEKAFSVLLKNSTSNEIRKMLFLSRIRERYVCPRIVQFINTSKEKK